MVLLQLLQLPLPLPHLLVFLLLFFGLLHFQVSGRGGFVLNLLLLLFLFLFLGLSCPIIFSFALSLAAGGAGLLLLDGPLHSLVGGEEFLARHWFTLFGGILDGCSFGWRVLGGRIAQMTLLELCQQRGH